MFNIPLIGAMAPTPDLLPKKKRDWRASLFDRLSPDSNLGEADKSKVGRQALLGLASGLLGTGGGFGNALSAGLQQGLLSMNQGADDVVNDRYRQAMMQRTMDGADRNSQIEAARSKVIKPDGTLDQAAWIQYVALDPEGGKQIRDAIEGPQTRWQLGQVGDGLGGTVDVFYNPMNPADMRTIDGKPIGAGLLGDQQAPAAPQFGILRDAVEQVESGGNPLAVSTAGAIGPMQTMPGTLRDPGFGVAPARDGSIDEQRRVGNDYLSAMLNKYADPRLALAAYNAGPGRVDQAMAAGGGAEAALSRLPQETRDYVPKVLGHAGFAQAQPGLGRRPAKAQTQADRYRTLGADEVEQLGLPVGTVAQQGPTGQIQIVNKPRDIPNAAGGQVIDNGDGTTTFIPAGKTSEGERNAAGFYQRMVSANAQMRALEDAGYSPTSATGIRDQMTAGRTATNWAASPEGQQYQQAAMNWVRANLRKESGAAIGVDEARNEIANYFPQPGDKPATVKQKADQRRVVEQAMRTAAGGALAPPSQKAASAPDKDKVAQGTALLKEARDAIMRGAPKEAVRQRLIEQGFTHIAGRL